MGHIGKSFASKLKNITLLAISRIAILKNHRKAKVSYAHYDISQLLKLGYYDQALLRVSINTILFLKEFTFLFYSTSI